MLGNMKHSYISHEYKKPNYLDFGCLYHRNIAHNKLN
jgi:hypothetical protein